MALLKPRQGLLQRSRTSILIAWSSCVRSETLSPPSAVGVLAVNLLIHALLAPRVNAPHHTKASTSCWRLPSCAAVGQLCRATYSTLGSSMALTSLTRWSSLVVFAVATASLVRTCCAVSSQTAPLRSLVATWHPRSRVDAPRLVTGRPTFCLASSGGHCSLSATTTDLFSFIASPDALSHFARRERNAVMDFESASRAVCRLHIR